MAKTNTLRAFKSTSQQILKNKNVKELKLYKNLNVFSVKHTYQVLSSQMFISMLVMGKQHPTE